MLELFSSCFGLKINIDDFFIFINKLTEKKIPKRKSKHSNVCTAIAKIYDH